MVSCCALFFRDTYATSVQLPLNCACHLPNPAAAGGVGVAATLRLLYRQHACCLPNLSAAAQVPTFQPTQGDAVLGLDAALGQLSFQEMLAESEPAAEQPAELPEWACA